ncbi:DNA repair protein rhp54 [Hordeum vulgare]|nr:DNA repair protein rhp54 [Hordeum vulgare]
MRRTSVPPPPPGPLVGGSLYHFPPFPPKTLPPTRSLPTPTMDDDLDAAAGLASLASSGMRTSPSGKGKCKATAAPKPKKTMTPEQRAWESAKRKGRRDATDVGDEAIAATAAAQQEVTNTCVAAATREALYMLGLNPNQHDLVNVAVAAASTFSSAFPRMVLLDSPRASACTPMPGFYVYPQASRLSAECSPKVSMVAPSTPAPIEFNATPVAGGSSSGGARKRARQMPANVLLGACNLFDGMSVVGDEDDMQNLIFESSAPDARYDPDETQSQKGRGAFTPSTFDQDQAAFMRDQVGMDLEGFPLDHEFPEDYEKEEEDECYIEGEPWFKD